MATVNRSGIDIHFETAGSGPPVVLGHSFLCSGDMWAPQVPRLAERHRVINVDLRGHGRSGVVDRPFDLYDLVDDVLVVLDHLKVEEAVWAGLSIGGMVALRAALVAPARVSGLILLDTHAGDETRFNRIKYLAMATAARVLGTEALGPQLARMFFSPHTRNTNPGLVREWRERFISVPLPAVRRTVAALRARDSIVDRLGGIRTPALVVVGADDELLPPSYSRELAGALPRARLVAIERAGHLPTLEQPDATTSAMLSFLDQLSGWPPAS